MQKTHFMSAFFICKISVIEKLFINLKVAPIAFYRFISTETTVATLFLTVNFTL